VARHPGAGGEARPGARAERHLRTTVHPRTSPRRGEGDGVDAISGRRPRSKEEEYSTARRDEPDHAWWKQKRGGVWGRREDRYCLGGPQEIGPNDGRATAGREWADRGETAAVGRTDDRTLPRCTARGVLDEVSGLIRLAARRFGTPVSLEGSSRACQRAVGATGRSSPGAAATRRWVEVTARHQSSTC